MASTNTTIPSLTTAPRTLHFFTVPKEGYKLVSLFFISKDLEYGIFFASFLNYTIRLAQEFSNCKKEVQNTREDFNGIWIFKEQNTQPIVNAIGFCDAMEAYLTKQCTGGLCLKGEIDLSDGRMATHEEIEKAQAVLATILYTPDERKEYAERLSDLAWLFSGTSRRQKRAKKTQKRAEEKATVGMGEMALGD